MSKKIILFNVIYYFLTVILILLGRNDPGSSLGYGYFIIVLWIIAGALLAILLFKKTIRPRSIADKMGVFLATPVLSIVCFSIFFHEGTRSEWYFDRDNYQWKQITVNYESSGEKRIEYFRSAHQIASSDAPIGKDWVKDSTWVYLSGKGDTVKKVTYKNNTEVTTAR